MPRRSRPRLSRCALFVALAVSGCDTPSSQVDGGDLLGVFDKDASAPDASVAAASASAAPAAEKPAPNVRAPQTGACVEPSGEPNREIRRTLGRPACRDAQVLEWKDSEGAPRYACMFAPRGVEARAPLPTIVFFHGENDDPTAVHKKTGLRKLASRFDLTGDPAHAGFIVLAVQGRSIANGKLGWTYDAAYVDERNVDVATVDHFLGEIEARGLVDTRRVYAFGDSRGGHMAATYAMLRASRVAAFATYGCDAPPARWTCEAPPPPAFVAYRACDDAFPCSSVETWLRARDDASAETAWLRLGASNDEEPSCTVKNKCTTLRGSQHHRRWPKEREEDVLKFFAGHALLMKTGG